MWEIVNLTADAHPIHLHLVQFQLINRQNFNEASTPQPTTRPSQAAAMTHDGCPTGRRLHPGFGPPLNYNTGQPGRQLGGNPDITPFLQGRGHAAAATRGGLEGHGDLLPGQVTRIAVRWAPTDMPDRRRRLHALTSRSIRATAAHGYVWHCHIIDHEDNEMMRPDVVQLNPSAPGPASRPLVKGTAY